MRAKLFALGSVLAVTAAILGYLWWGRFRYEAGPYLTGTYIFCILTIAFNHWYFGDDRQSLGLRLDNLFRAGRYFLPVTIGLALPVGILGLTSERFHPEPWDSTLLYLLWALLQQHGLQNFFFRRLQTVTGARPAALVLAALFFALLHSPNWILVVSTLLAALVWCWAFAKAPNLLVAGASHAFLALLVLAFFKFDGLQQFQIGRPGFRYESFGGGVLVAGGYGPEGQPVVVTLPGHDRDSVSEVRVFDPSGRRLHSWVAFPELTFSAQIAVGDLGFGPGDEVVVSPGPSPENPPLIGVFDLSGNPLEMFRAGDWHGYGAFVSILNQTILASPGPEPGRRAAACRYRPDGALLECWNFDDLQVQNGIRVAGIAEAITNDDMEPLLLLWPHPLSVNPSQLFLYRGNRQLRHWDAYGATYGLNVSPLRLAPGKGALVTAPGPLAGYSAHVRVFDLNGSEISTFFPPGGERDACGANTAAVDVNGDGRDEVVLGDGICPGFRPRVRILDLEGNLLYQWEAY